ncbi:peptide deformylase [Thermodesulfobacterium sp. TA1]|uniref:peptide deformylase n=1 Tax=Thermodesulfobacterium sp. TA1 TaxID=2234087 RepID=UPI001232D250|nr:peptide deformylase [Thermodesulfobacterium sp. TA1]QER42298.1 peptide deformylase [Thermodesulfobacterium sp. TA1]
MEILTLGHPTLREKALPVENIDGEIKKLVEEMAQTMYKAKGLGLAANQVGVLKRIFLLDILQKEGTPKLEVYINPEILQAEGYTTYEEGCLSIPGYYAKVERYSKLYIRALDLQGNLVEKELDGLHAIAFQHEYDHLEGILFVDRLSPLKRTLFQKWWKKNQPKK